MEVEEARTHPEPEPVAAIDDGAAPFLRGVVAAAAVERAMHVAEAVGLVVHPLAPVLHVEHPLEPVPAHVDRVRAVVVVLGVLRRRRDPQHRRQRALDGLAV